MNRFNKAALSLVAALSLLAVGASSASAKPGKSTFKSKAKSSNVVVKQGHKGRKGKQTKVTYKGKQSKHGKVVVKTRPGKVVISLGKRAPRHRYSMAPRITAAEHRQITRAQRTLARMQARFYRDGILSRSERRALSNQRLKVQRTIARARMS